MSVPGTFIMVDHSLERAFNRGALAQLKVTGEKEELVYSGKQFDLIYQPEGTGIRVAEQAVPAPAAKTKAERIELGAQVFANNCQACHQADGQGVPDAFPRGELRARRPALAPGRCSKSEDGRKSPSIRQPSGECRSN
jgi:nitrite reductase (NO-forming)